MVVQSDVLPRATLVGGPIPNFQGGLFESESDRVARAVPKRAREFCAGRTAARRALAVVGVPGQAIPAGSGGEPVWPAGFTGSITHSDSHCFAIVASTRHYRALGIDLERKGRIGESLWHLLFTKEESERLRSMVPEIAGNRATILFSAKEAFLKAAFMMTRERLDFTRMHVDSHGDGEFDVRPPRGMFARSSFSGVVHEDNNHVFTAIGVPHE